MRLNIEYIIAEREKREREKRDRELDEGRRLPLYIEPPCNGDNKEESEICVTMLKYSAHMT